MSLRDDGAPSDRMQSRRQPVQHEQEFEAFLMYLNQRRGFDFTVYQRSHLQRRLENRLQALHMRRIRDYWDYIERQPDEFTQLLNEMLNRTTAFFRDRAAWTYLSETILPQLVASTDGQAGLRLWSAGCASGEEAYTLAIVLAEVLGLETFQRRVRIFATDINDRALARARGGTYSATALRSLPAGLGDKYFEPVKHRFAVHPALRNSIIFGHQNLVHDAPIPHLDLLVCRNTFMYFAAETQTRILSRFYFALKDAGILFLGKAEAPFTQTYYFAPVHLASRLFAKRRTAIAQTPPLDSGAVVHCEFQEPEGLPYHSEAISAQLQTSHEEFAMMHEKLQASYEELEITSEELQATNEELQTLNNELQASTISLNQHIEDCQKRHDELQQSLSLTQFCFASLPRAVIVIDLAFSILMWNRQASDLWGLESYQTEGQSLLQLNIGLSVAAIEGRIRSLLAGQSAHEELFLDAVHRLGQPIRCRVTCTPLWGRTHDIQGAVLLMEAENQHD